MPGPGREILAPTDFSETSDAAVRVAHAYARAFGARLHVLHVSWPDEHGLTELFAVLVAQLGTAVPVAMASHRGDTVVRYAKAHGIHLIVLGAHGRTGVSRASEAASHAKLTP